MKWLLILAALAGGGFVAYKTFARPQPPPVASPEKTPAADVKNRVDKLSGAAPE